MLELSHEERIMARRFSHSQMKTWDRCEQKWVYNYQWDILKKGKGNRWLRRGTLVHELLSVVDQMIIQGVPIGDPVLWDYVIEFCETDLSVRMPFDQLENYEAALRVAKRYVFEWMPLMDSKIKVISVEDEFDIPMETPKGRKILLNGYIDRVHQDEYGQVVVLDRKTSAQPKHWTDAMLETDSQTAYYAIVLREMGLTPWSVEVDSITTYNYKYFENEPLAKIFKRLRCYRPAKELDFFLDTFTRQIDRVLDFLESGEEPVKSIDKDCSMCPYVDLCVYQMKGIPIDTLLEEMYDNKHGKHVTEQVPKLRLRESA